MTRGHYSHLDKYDNVEQTIRELTVDLCIQTIQSRYMGDNNREDMEVKSCVNSLRRLINERRMTATITELRAEVMRLTVELKDLTRSK